MILILCDNIGIFLEVEVEEAGLLTIVWGGPVPRFHEDAPSHEPCKNNKVREIG